MLDSWEKVIDPNFINSELIGTVGAEKVVTITNIDFAECYDEQTKQKVQKQTVFFEECKPLVLNKTNAKTLKRLFSPNSDNPADAVGHKVSRGLLAQVVAEQHLICVLVQREVQETDDVHGRIVELRIVGLRPRLAEEVPAVFLHCEHLLLYREGGVEQHPLREMDLPFPLHLHHEAAA